MLSLRADIDFNRISKNADKLHFYPNPVEHSISIENNFKEKGVLSVGISSITGEKIISFDRDVSKGSYKQTIDLSGLSAGVYNVLIQFKDEYVVKQLVKMK